MNIIIRSFLSQPIYNMIYRKLFIEKISNNSNKKTKYNVIEI